MLLNIVPELDNIFMYNLMMEQRSLVGTQETADA